MATPNLQPTNRSHRLRSIGALLAGLHPGDTIRTIDGRDFEDFFRSVRKYIAVSSVREARFALVYCPYFLHFGTFHRSYGARHARWCATRKKT
jgi:hypothetical protein